MVLNTLLITKIINKLSCRVSCFLKGVDMQNVLMKLNNFIC